MNTEQDGHAITIDPESIVLIEPATADPDGPARILLATGEEIRVGESADQVVARLEAIGVVIR